jgi:hypothetical protein
LRVTELRYYLFPLMVTPPTNRPPQLAVVPDEIRSMVQLRLQSWDQLTPEKQRELLDNETAVRYLIDIESRSPEQQERALTNMPPALREALDESIRKWQQLDQDQRSAITMRFERFFGLSRQEKERTLRTLSEQERVQIAKTLQTFDKLEPAKRAQCIRSLDKLSRLSPAERQDFLKNAERWKVMTPDERTAWRNLVLNLSRQPPLPPGVNRPPLPPLPKPPLPPTPVASESIATNR